MAGKQNGRDWESETRLWEEMACALKTGLYGANSEESGFKVSLAHPGRDHSQGPGKFPWRCVAQYSGPLDYQTPTDGSSRGVRWQSEEGVPDHMSLHVSMARPFKDKWWLEVPDAVGMLLGPVLDRAGLGRESLQPGSVSQTNDYRQGAAGVNMGFYICPPPNHRTTPQWEAYRALPNL